MLKISWVADTVKLGSGEMSRSRTQEKMSQARQLQEIDWFCLHFDKKYGGGSVQVNYNHSGSEDQIKVCGSAILSFTLYHFVFSSVQK